MSGSNQVVTSPQLRTIFTPYSMLRQFSDNFYQYVGVSLQIPIFNRFQNRHNIVKARLAHENELAFNSLTEYNIARIVKQALQDIKYAEEKLQTYQDKLNSAKLLMESSNKRFLSGFINSFDNNIALINFNKSELDFITAQYEVFFKYQILNFYVSNKFED